MSPLVSPAAGGSRIPPFETKHERFQRLAAQRTTSALDKMRMLTQLRSHNYENTPKDAYEIVTALDRGVQQIARVFGVPFTSAVGRASAQLSQGRLDHVGPLDELDVIKAIELINQDRADEAAALLRQALMGQPR